MIFQHTWELIRNGEKTQTRRTVKAGETLELSFKGYMSPYILTPNGVRKWVVGSEHAVQDGRGKPCVVVDGKPLRIRILSLWKEDVRYISDEDVKAEGFKSYHKFLKTWCGMHDKTFYENNFQDKLSERPDHLYTAWVIKFEVVK